MVKWENDNPSACCGGLGPRKHVGVSIASAVAALRGKVVTKPEIKIDDPDFETIFRESQWTIAWKWPEDKQPGRLQSRVLEYRCTPAEEVKEPYEGRSSLGSPKVGFGSGKDWWLVSFTSGGGTAHEEQSATGNGLPRA